jgi:hypothetical protein
MLSGNFNVLIDLTGDLGNEVSHSLYKSGITTGTLTSVAPGVTLSLSSTHDPI